MNWTVTFFSDEVEQELDALPRDYRASFERIVHLIELRGLHMVHEPYIKHLEGPLWEMRLRGKGGIARAIYLTAQERRIVVLRVFAKKTQKTPRREIEIAMRRARDVK
jgi:phage-related protein